MLLIVKRERFNFLTSLTKLCHWGSSIAGLPQHLMLRHHRNTLWPTL